MITSLFPIILILVVLSIATFIIYTYNSLIKTKIASEEGWSGIEVQLKRRHDLIPNIVSAIKGYTKHEEEVFTKITEMRNQSISAKTVKQISEKETFLSGGISKLLAVVEAYPDLKADQNFLKLQEELSEVEDDLQNARRYYNGTIRNYEILRQSFPANLIANAFSFTKKDYFELENRAIESQNPEINF